MTVILLNCVTLGMYQPCGDLNCDTRRCQILKVTHVWYSGHVYFQPRVSLSRFQKADDVIYLYFTIEMFIKMLAMGVAGRGCYLSETWNRLDCFIVLAG